jgi:hypothetical protein
MSGATKTKAEIAFDYIAGLRAGVEQDIADDTGK